jgi:hypothetical protein
MIPDYYDPRKVAELAHPTLSNAKGGGAMRRETTDFGPLQMSPTVKGYAIPPDLVRVRGSLAARAASSRASASWVGATQKAMSRAR